MVMSLRSWSSVSISRLPSSFFRLPCYVPILPFPAGLGKIAAKVPSTRLLAEERGIRHQGRRCMEIPLLGGARRQSLADGRELIAAAPKSRRRSRDRAIGPHQLTNLVCSHLGGTAVIE